MYLTVDKRIIRHVQEVIKLGGGNEYREGSKERQRRFDWRKEAKAVPAHKQLLLGRQPSSERTHRY